MVTIYLYPIVELLNIVYTLKFALKAPSWRPAKYKQVRFYFKGIKYCLAVASGTYLILSQFYLYALLILIAPFLIERVLFVYCRARAIQQMVKQNKDLDVTSGATYGIDQDIHQGYRLF